MKRFINNLSASGKFFLSFGIILTLLAVVIGMAYVSLNNLAKSEQSLRDQEVQTLLSVYQIRSNQNYIRAQMLLMTLEPAQMDDIEALIMERSSETDSLIAEMEEIHSADTHLMGDIQRLKNHLSDWREIRDRTLAEITAGNMEQAFILEEGISFDQFERVRMLTVEMTDEQKVDLEAKLAADQLEAQSFSMVMLIFGVFALVITIALVFILNWAIARPLNMVTKVAEQISSGDLTVNVDAGQRQDEVGKLTKAFQQMVAMFRQGMSDTSQAVETLGSSASEILASTSQVASGTAETATAINETTATVEEVRQAAELSAQKAQSVSDTAQRVAQVSREGQKSVEETTDGMGRIREQMETIAQTVIRLSEQGQSIGGIIASVTDLADQSNLLAVNAAIEAAKAGEQGAGFAVVAQEIRSLAEQSKLATIQVRGILSEIEKATSNAVMATEQGNKAVEAGVSQASQAGEAIRILSETSEEALQATEQILASSQQQVVGMDQIGTAMENVNQASAQNAASMEQMEIAAQDLHKLGQKLKELVDQFKV